MKKILLSLLVIASTSIYSQELDKAYLESLPESVREDVLKQIEEKEENEKPVYRRPSSFVKKPTSDKGSTSDKKPTSDKKITSDSEINRFGDRIFNMMQSSFMPVNEPNFDGSYILDFGDTLEIQLTGMKDSIDKLPINRDGSINISSIGKIMVSGLSLESASSLIKSKVSSAFIGTEAFISLVNIRDIQILISGNAYNPGIYTLNGNSNALHALAMAGGISKDGSYREIDILRNGAVIDTIDLYDIFIFGRSNFGVKLRSGDSIFIKQAAILVNAVSGVNRPAIYELKKNDSYQDLVNFSNGFITTADLEYITIQRLVGNKADLILLDIDNLSSTTASNRDSFYVREFKFGSIEISGAVKDPGTYSITDDDSLMTLIKKAGGYKNEAYPFGGFLNNKKTELINEDAKEKLYNQFIKNMSSSGPSSTSNDNLQIILAELRNTPTSGRVMAEFDLDLLEQDPDLDTNLEDGDKIFIPTITQQVYVYGEINNQGTVRYSAAKNINFYIDSAGGLLKSSDDRSIFVVHPNGRTETLSLKNSRFGFLDQREDVLIYPGSIIYVPKSVDITDATAYAAIWAPIISSVALSLTSLSVLNNNN